MASARALRSREKSICPPNHKCHRTHGTRFEGGSTPKSKRTRREEGEEEGKERCLLVLMERDPDVNLVHRLPEDERAQ